MFQNLFVANRLYPVDKKRVNEFGSTGEDPAAKKPLEPPAVENKKDL